MFNSYKLYFLIILTLYFTACTTFERNIKSGYYKPDKMNSIVANNREQIALLNELGISPDSLNSPEVLERYSSLLELKSLEKNLFDEREKRQYYNVLPWLKDDQERLEFLKQPGYAAKQLWLRKNEVGARPTIANDETEDLIEKKDISIGMPEDFVKRSWGTPDQVEVAGNPIYRNQRWKYKRYIASSDGYKLQSRVIYFEGGRVIGWEQNEY